MFYFHQKPIKWEGYRAKNAVISRELRAIIKCDSSIVKTLGDKMGVNASAISHGYLGEEEANIFVQRSYFTLKQIYILSHKYRQMSKDSRISLADFEVQMNIPNHEIAEILFKIIDEDGSGEITFPEFIEGLNKFHPEAPFDEKVKLCFKAYDSDGSGLVSADEIRNIIQISLRNNQYLDFTEPQINELVTQLINTYSRTKTELTYDEFYNMVSKAPGVIEAFDIDTDLLIEQS